jgi:glycosyltransferase involved in cell wall biosynthesis
MNFAGQPPSIPAAAPRWSVVLPYFNEVEYLPATLAALIAQDGAPFQLILVDNASTDGSGDLCRELLKGCRHITTIYLHEPRPGKTNALECGLARVDTEFVAFCDADTYYPPHYLRRCDEVFARAPKDVVAVMASRLSGPPRHGRPRLRQIKTMIRARIFTKQSLTGGFGQSFRTSALGAVGGFSTEIWPFVLEDHEIMQRIFKVGRSRYDFDLWCVPSMRRKNRKNVDWTYLELRMYGVVPFIFKDWYFYKFLHNRFAARNLDQVNLREKSWLPASEDARS